MRERIPAAAIDANAEWWSRQFRDPEPLEANYSGTALTMAQGAEHFGKLGAAPGVEQIAAFRDRLAALLTDLAGRLEYLPLSDPALLVVSGHLGLKIHCQYVDYPDAILDAALAHADISRWWLPTRIESWLLPQCAAAGPDTAMRIIWTNTDLEPLPCVRAPECGLPMLHDGPHRPPDEASDAAPS